MAVDSKNNLYVADQKVGAIFIFNTETREVDLIKNKEHAHFVRIIGWQWMTTTAFSSPIPAFAT